MPRAKASGSSVQTQARRSVAASAKQPSRDYWYIDDILDERNSSTGIEYLVRWQGKDPKTLRAWPLEWIPRSWANKTAESSWLKRKQETTAGTSRPAPPQADQVTNSDPTAAESGSGSSRLNKVAPGAYVQVANVDIDLLEDTYPFIDVSSQTSTELSQTTQSWCESPSQHSITVSSQLTPSSQPQLSLYAPSEFSSPATARTTQRTHFETQYTVPSSSFSLSEIESCSIRRFSIGNSSSQVSSGLELISISTTIPSAQIVPPCILNSSPDRYTQGSIGFHRTVHTGTPQNSGAFVSLSSTPSSARQSYHTPRSVSIIRESPKASAVRAFDSNHHSPAPSPQPPIINFPGTQSQRGSVIVLQSSLSRQILPSTARETRQPQSSNYIAEPSPSTLQANINKMSTNGGRQQSFPSPPMQDRVRMIRNSAISTQNRRPASDDNSPMSSRSNSLAPESGRAKPSNESRADSRPPENAANYQFLDHFPEESDTSETSSTAKFELNLPPNGENMEYYLALSLPSRVKSQYDTTIKLYKKPMTDFLDDVLDSDTVQSMQQLVKRLNNVSTHIDLENEEWERTQDELPADQTKWALSSGSKFVFLHSLCNSLRDNNLHVVVVAKEPRLLFILEKFMQGMKIDYARPDTGKRTLTSSQSRLKVSLIQSGSQSQKGPWSAASVIIAFDGSFDANAKHIKALRQNSAVHGGLTPVVHPLVYCSAEHLSKCIDGLEGLRSDQDKLRALILAIDERQSELGEMQDEDFWADAAGEEVALFVEGGAAKSLWTPVPVRPVKVLSLETILPRDVSQEPEADPTAVDVVSPSRKRASEEDLYDEGQKRQRMSPIGETTQISESTIASQNTQLAELRQALEAAETAARKSAQQVALLQAAIAEKDQSLTDIGKVIDDLQNRFEKSKRSIVRLGSEREVLESRVRDGRERFDKLDATRKFYIDENKKLNSELDEVRGELARSTIPEVAQLEQVRGENRALQSEKEKLERKVASISQDFEFTRQQYQQASTKAAEHAERLQSLEEENNSLQRKAAGEAVRAREMTNRQEMEQHVAENTRLLAEVEELKEQLKRKERGRGMTTRTGSAAPRSPRLGTSPGRSRAGSRAPGSRPGSPVRSVHGPRRRGNPLDL